MSFDRIARLVSRVDAFLPYQQDRIAPAPFRGSSSLQQPPPHGQSNRATAATAQPPRVGAVCPAPPTAAVDGASRKSGEASSAPPRTLSPSTSTSTSTSESTATDSVLFPVPSYQPLATFSVAYFHRVRVRYLFLFSLLTAALTVAILAVYGAFFRRCAVYLLPIAVTSASITVALPLLSLCQREIAGRCYTLLAFSFLLGHFASFTWWSFSPSADDILTSYNSLSPAVLLLCSYFLMNLSTALLFAVLTLLVELLQSALILLDRPDVGNNISAFNSQQVWLYLLDSGHVCVLFLLVFLLLQAWQSEHRGDLHEAERLLVDTQRRAEANGVNKSLFMSALAHDIRTPLNGILSGLALTLDDPALSLSSEHRDYLQMAHSSASSLLYLLQDVSTISRLDSCSLHFDKVEFDLVETVERTVRSFSLDAERQSVQLLVDIASSVPSAVRGDPTRLGQLLSNIVCNALKFSDRGGAVTVSCEAVTLDGEQSTISATGDDVGVDSVVLDVNKRSVRFVPVVTAPSSPRSGTPAARLLPVAVAAPSARPQSARPSSGRVCLHFAVRDEGVGIPADKLQSVFGRFEQASPDVAQSYAGRGLGLAIAAGLVRLHGGVIWCESIVRPTHATSELMAGGGAGRTGSGGVSGGGSVQHGSTFHFLVYLDLRPGDSYASKLSDDESRVHSPSASSPQFVARARHLDDPAVIQREDSSLLTSALARVRRLTGKQHSRSSSNAVEQPAPSAVPTSLVAASASSNSSRVSAVSARLLSHATGLSTVASGGSMRASVSVSTGETASAVLRRELLALGGTDSYSQVSTPTAAAALSVTTECEEAGSRAALQLSAAAPRSPSARSSARVQRWRGWCSKYAAVLVCVRPQQTRQAVSGWVRDWQDRKRAEAGAEEVRTKQPAVVSLSSEGQLMSGVSECLTAMQFAAHGGGSPSSLRRGVTEHPSAAHEQFRLTAHTAGIVGGARDESACTVGARMLLIIDDFHVAGDAAGAATLSATASVVPAISHSPLTATTASQLLASPSLSFPSAARHSHLTRNRHAAKCLKMVASLLKARQCDADVAVDVLFLLSAGSAAMRVEWPGLRYSGSMTSPASRLSLYRLLDSAATGADGGGGERTVFYRSERHNAAPLTSPRAVSPSIAPTASSTAADGGQRSSGSVAGGGGSWTPAGTPSRSSSPVPPHPVPTAHAVPAHASRVSEGASAYVPSSRSNLAQLNTASSHLSTQERWRGGAAVSAHGPAGERPLFTRPSPHLQPPCSEACDGNASGPTAGETVEASSDQSPPRLSAVAAIAQTHAAVPTSVSPINSATDTPNLSTTSRLTSPAAHTVAAATIPQRLSAITTTLQLEPLPSRAVLGRDTIDSAATPRLPPAALVSLPAPQPPHSATAASSRSVSAPAAIDLLGTVLVVDDILTNRKMAASVLRRMGLHSRLCDSGEDALAVFKQAVDGSTGASRFVCCLMDIRMPPGMSGHECARLMREWERQQAAQRAERAEATAVEGTTPSQLPPPPPPPPRLPIFALTANVLDDDRQLAFTVGMDAYLEKPLDAAKLRQQLANFHIPTLDAKGKRGTAPRG